MTDRITDRDLDEMEARCKAGLFGIEPGTELPSEWVDLPRVIAELRELRRLAREVAGFYENNLLHRAIDITIDVQIDIDEAFAALKAAAGGGE